MNLRSPWTVLLAVALLASDVAQADASLQSSLQLTTAQAGQTDEIEARYRKGMASIRQEFNRESRALRRARIAKDEAEIARLEGVTEALRARMVVLRDSTDEEIRGVLTPAQHPLFDDYLTQRRSMQGSSRDERTFED